jgi:uncharacterized membrane protein YoaK (UPF0700 family)
MLTVTLVCVGAAFVTAIASALGKCPVWIPVVLLCIVELLQVLPK